MNEQEQISQGLNICLFSAFARACNAAEAVEEARDKTINAPGGGMIPFARLDDLAFAARASAVALAAAINKAVCYYIPPIPRYCVAIAALRLQRATAAAEDAAKQAGITPLPSAEYKSDITPAQILDFTERCVVFAQSLEAAGKDARSINTLFAEFECDTFTAFDLKYASPQVLIVTARHYCSGYREFVMLQEINESAIIRQEQEQARPQQYNTESV